MSHFKMLRALQIESLNGLRVSRHKIDRLVAEFDVSTIDVQNNSFDRFLAGECNAFPVLPHPDLQAETFDRWELKKLERFGPKVPIADRPRTKDSSGLSYQLQERASTAFPCSNRADTTSGLDTSLSLVRSG